MRRWTRGRCVPLGCLVRPAGAAIALTVMFLLQFVVLVSVLQAVSIARDRGSSNDDFEFWSLLAVSICGFLVLGACIVRVALVDAPHTIEGIRFFFLDLYLGNHNQPITFNGIQETDENCFRHAPTPPLNEECKSFEVVDCNADDGVGSVCFLRATTDIIKF